MEAEALLLGSWKNIEELEEALNLNELQAIVKAGREKEHRIMRFYGLFKGVDIDKSNTEERYNEVVKRAEARLRGKTVDEMEFEDFGIDVEKL